MIAGKCSTAIHFYAADAIYGECATWRCRNTKSAEWF